VKNHHFNQGIIFSVIGPIIYIIADIYRLPMGTFFPAINEWHWGWVAMSDERGPGMYWYGWLATASVSAAVLSWILAKVGASINPIAKWLVQYLWILPIALLIPLVISLKYYWR